MKTWLLIAGLILSCNFARAEDDGVALLTALNKLHRNVRVGRLHPLGRTEAAGLIFGTLGAVGFIGGRIGATSSKGWVQPVPGQLLVRTRFGQWASHVEQISTNFIYTGVVLLAGHGLLRLMKVAPRGRAHPADYYKESALRMKFFFSLPVAEQYQLAHGDPELTEFIFDLQHALDLVANGYPRQPPAPPAP